MTIERRKPARPPTVARLLAALFLLTTSCFSGDGCDVDFDACDNDADCGTDAVCEASFLGRACVPAVECQIDGDCAPGESCVERPPSPPQNPFDTDLEGKRICECSGDDCFTTVSTSVSTSATTGGGMGGSGGSGGSGGIGGSGGSGGGALGGGGAGGMGGGT